MSPRPTVTATRFGSVLAAVLFGFGIVWVGVSLIRVLGGSLPRAGFISWVSIALLGVGTGWLAARTHRRLQKDRVSVEPHRAVRWLAWGKTSLLAGAGIAGAWLAFGVAAVPGLPAPLAVERIVHAVIAVLASVGWAVAGWFLERSCRIPPDSEDESTTPPDASTIQP